MVRPRHSVRIRTEQIEVVVQRVAAAGPRPTHVVVCVPSVSRVMALVVDLLVRGGAGGADALDDAARASREQSIEGSGAQVHVAEYPSGKPDRPKRNGGSGLASAGARRHGRRVS